MLQHGRPAHNVQILDRSVLCNRGVYHHSAPDTGRFGDAVRLAEQAITCDPAAEEGYRRLMRWHYLRGDRAAAIAVWDRCKDVLRREYGLAPSAQTAQFGQAILGSLKPVTISTPPRAIPITVLRPPRLIGRRKPLQKMGAAWSQGEINTCSNFIRTGILPDLHPGVERE